MHYGEQRQPSLERFLPHIIVFNALWWAKEALTWKISTSHYCLQCIMVSKGRPHLKDFYLALLSSMHYGEQRKTSLERFLPRIIVFNALWWAKEALTWKISTSHYCLQCIMVSKGSPHLKDFYLNALLLSSLLSSMHYGEQRKPSLERFLPHIIVFNALWWAKEALTISTSHYCLQCIMVSKGALTWKISTSHYCLQCIMVSKGSPHLKDFYLTLLSSMHYGEQRKPSLERFLPNIIVFNAEQRNSLERFLPHNIVCNALWWAKEALTWQISTSHYYLQCIMVSKGSPHLKDFYLTLLSSMHYGEQRKPSLERFLPHIIVFNALWWAKEALTWKISTSHYCLQCIMVSKGSTH